MTKESSGIMASTLTPEPNDNRPNISAGQVKELRDQTGAPMMDCKKAATAESAAETPEVEHQTY